MEALLVLLTVYLFAVLVVFPIWTLMKTGGQSDRQDRLAARLAELEAEVRKLRTSAVHAPAAAVKTESTPAPAQPAVAAPSPVVRETLGPPAPMVPPGSAAGDRPPEAPPHGALARPAPAAEPPALPPVIAAPSAPVTPRPVYTPPPPKPNWIDTINWEQFMGA